MGFASADAASAEVTGGAGGGVPVGFGPQRRSENEARSSQRWHVVPGKQRIPPAHAAVTSILAAKPNPTGARMTPAHSRCFPGAKSHRLTNDRASLSLRLCGLPPKLTSERVSSLVQTLKSNYPGELLDAIHPPSRGPEARTIPEMGALSVPGTHGGKVILSSTFGTAGCEPSLFLRHP